MFRRLLFLTVMFALALSACAPGKVSPTPPPPTPQPSPTTTPAPTPTPPDQGQPGAAPALEKVSGDNVARLAEIAHVDAAGTGLIAVDPLGRNMAWVEDSQAIVANMPYPAGALRLEGHTAPITGIGWSPDGRLIVTGSQDGTIRFWDAGAGSELSKIALGSPVAALAWSPDGSVIAVGDTQGFIHLLDGFSSDETGKVDAGGGQPVSAIAWSANSEHFAVMVGSGPGVLRLWRADATADPTPAVSDAIAAGPTSIAWSPRADSLAWISAADQQVRIWAPGGKPDSVILAGSRGVNRLAWSPDGALILGGGAQTGAQVWDAARGASLLALPGSGGAVTAVGWSPEGSFLVTVDAGGPIHIWGVPAS